MNYLAVLFLITVFYCSTAIKLNHLQTPSTTPTIPPRSSTIEPQKTPTSPWPINYTLPGLFLNPHSLPPPPSNRTLAFNNSSWNFSFLDALKDNITAQFQSAKQAWLDSNHTKPWFLPLPHHGADAQNITQQLRAAIQQSINDKLNQSFGAQLNQSLLERQLNISENNKSSGLADAFAAAFNSVWSGAQSPQSVPPTVQLPVGSWNLPQTPALISGVRPNIFGIKAENSQISPSVSPVVISPNLFESSS